MTDIPGQTMRSAIRAEVVARLVVFARGRAAAVTGERLAELVAEALAAGGMELHLKPSTLQRRCQEAVEQLIEKGEPIGSSSCPPRGYWWAEVAEDLEESLAEADRRARKALLRRRFLRQRVCELRGQVRLPAVQAPPPEPDPYVEPEQLGLLASGGRAA